MIYPKAFNQDKIPEGERFHSEEFIRQLKGKGVNALYFETVDEIVGELLEDFRSGDVILIMSNGGFDGIYGKLIERLSHKKP